MKKTLAILLALAMVFSSITVAFAEETLPADAKAVSDLGMLVGSGNGVTLDYLKETPSRISAAVMFLRLKGLEDEAKAFTGTDNFADASQAGWAAPIMAYLKANPNLGWIGNAGNFNPNGEMDAKSYYKVMLEALGYKQNTTDVIGDFTFAGVLEFAATKGLVKVATVTNFTVGDLATATIEALKATVKGSEKTLAASLVEAKVITEEAATAAGLYNVTPAALAVSSVKALNLVQVEVKFNKAVDKDTAEDEAMYTIDGIEIGKAVLQADGKTVLLTVNTMDDNGTPADKTDDTPDATMALTNDEEYTLEIDEELVEAEVEFLAIDTTVPVAQSIKLTGPNTFEITFSEPISGDNSTMTVELEDGVYGAVATADESNVVEVELGVSSLEAGKYEVEISGARDFNDLGALKKTFELDYVLDTTVPAPKLVSADQTEVVIDFGKRVVDEDGLELDEEYFYHSYSDYAPDSVEWKGSKVTLDFTTFPLPEGNVKIVVDYNAHDSVITDLWGNEMPGNAIFTAAITADETKPTVTKVDADDERNIEVYFSENVTVASATDDDNYEVKDKDGKVVDISSITYDADDKMATLIFDEDLDGTYTVKISDIEDDALVPNTMTTATLSFKVADSTPIQFTGVDGVEIYGLNGTKSDTILVHYPDDMMGTGQYSVLEKNNYTIDINDGNGFKKLKTDDTVTWFDGKKVVKISIADETAIDFTAGNFNVDIMIGRVADADDNKTVALASPAIAVALDTAPTIAEIYATDYKTIVIEYTGKVTGAVAGEYMISDGVDTLPAAGVAVTTNDDNETTVKLTLKSGVQLADDKVTEADSIWTVAVANANNKIKSATGLPLAPVGATAVLDKIPAKVSTVAQNGLDLIDVTFTEDVDITNVQLAASDFVIKDHEGDTLVAGVDFVVTHGTANILTIDLSGGEYAGLAEKLKVDTKDSITYIFDTQAYNNAGDKYVKAANIGTAKEVTMQLVGASIASIVETSTTVLTVTFSEAVTEAVVENATNWTLVDDVEAAATIDSIVWNATTRTATVTITGGTFGVGDTILAEPAILDAQGLPMNTAKDLGTRGATAVWTIN